MCKKKNLQLGLDVSCEDVKTNCCTLSLSPVNQCDFKYFLVLWYKCVHPEYTLCTSYLLHFQLEILKPKNLFKLLRCFAVTNVNVSRNLIYSVNRNLFNYWE